MMAIENGDHFDNVDEHLQRIICQSLDMVRESQRVVYYVNCHSLLQEVADVGDDEPLWTISKPAWDLLCKRIEFVGKLLEGKVRRPALLVQLSRLPPRVTRVCAGWMDQHNASNSDVTPPNDVPGEEE